VNNSLRRYAITVAVLWLVLPAAGLYYAHTLATPGYIAFAVIAACLLEAAFYIVPGFEGVSRRILRLGSGTRLACLLTAAGVAPYLVYALLSSAFSWQRFVLLLALAALASFWFVVMPRAGWSDSLFLLVMLAVYLSGLFRVVCPLLPAAPKVPVDFLPRLMWVRVGIAACLYLRRSKVPGFGFLPTWRDWKYGVLHFLCFLPLSYSLNLAIHFARLRTWPQDWTRPLLFAVPMFFGMLWVTVLTEEFFFRGLLQQWLRKWTASTTAAVLITAVLFGSVHLIFPPGFPNWRFAALASLAGVFYGLAMQNAGSLRAAMVTHALVNVTWRLFFV
jgi:uncharacterized protein